MITENQILILTTTLSNIYDWESSDLENDFVEFSSEQLPGIPTEKLKALFQKFDSLNPKLRDDPYFELKAFVQSEI